MKRVFSAVGILGIFLSMQAQAQDLLRDTGHSIGAWPDRPLSNSSSNDATRPGDIIGVKQADGSYDDGVVVRANTDIVEKTGAPGSDMGVNRNWEVLMPPKAGADWQVVQIDTSGNVRAAWSVDDYDDILIRTSVSAARAQLTFYREGDKANDANGKRLEKLNEKHKELVGNLKGRKLAGLAADSILTAALSRLDPALAKKLPGTQGMIDRAMITMGGDFAKNMGVGVLKGELDKPETFFAVAGDLTLDSSKAAVIDFMKTKGRSHADMEAAMKAIEIAYALTKGTIEGGITGEEGEKQREASIGAVSELMNVVFPGSGAGSKQALQMATLSIDYYSAKQDGLNTADLFRTAANAGNRAQSADLALARLVVYKSQFQSFLDAKKISETPVLVSDAAGDGSNVRRDGDTLGADSTTGAQHVQHTGGGVAR